MYICPEVLREPAGAHVPLAVLRRAGGLAGDASVWQTNRNNKPKHIYVHHAHWSQPINLCCFSSELHPPRDK